jgi:ABC-type multidrug transport system fused ATPase/permease subunit
VERVNEYILLESENLKEGILKPFESWPENGHVEFKNVSFAYADQLPNVLKNVSFKIQPRQKVGIIGRTGAGKSTIFQALLRISEPKGFIVIDGVNITHLSLEDLRSKVSIIPVSCLPKRKIWLFD